MKELLLTLLLTFAPAHHYIDKAVPDENNKTITYLKNVKWQPEAIPKHIVVYEDVLDLAYTILYADRIPPCFGECPEVVYQDGLIFFYSFAKNKAGHHIDEPGVVYVTKDIPAMYMLYDKEWHWYSFEVNNYR